MEQERDNTLQQIAEKALTDSVVRLEVDTPATYNDYVAAFHSKIKSVLEVEVSSASGFFIGRHLIVTNFHVVIGAYSIFAELAGTKDKFQIEGVVGYDAKNDLILLKVAYGGDPLILGDSDTVQYEDTVCAVGYPHGVVDIAHGTSYGIRASDNWIRMMINTSDGSSGCPIINRRGEVIGIDASGNEAYSYAIPSNTLKQLIKETVEAQPFKEWQKLPQIRAYAETKLGNKMRKNGEHKKAIAHYDTAIELKPDMVEAYEARALAKMKLGVYTEAIADQLTVHQFKLVSFSFSNFRAYFSWKRKEINILGKSLFVKLLKLFWPRKYS